MIDPNTGTELGESADIVAYLFERYGGGAAVPFLCSSNPLNTTSLFLASLARAGGGSRYVPARQPAQPLELWAYEPSPFSVIARETLCELELPHILHYCPRGSVHRDEVFERTGTFQVPLPAPPPERLLDVVGEGGYGDTSLPWGLGLGGPVRKAGGVPCSTILLVGGHLWGHWRGAGHGGGRTSTKGSGGVP